MDGNNGDKKSPRQRHRHGHRYTKSAPAMTRKVKGDRISTHNYQSSATVTPPARGTFQGVTATADGGGIALAAGAAMAATAAAAAFIFSSGEDGGGGGGDGGGGGCGS